VNIDHVEVLNESILRRKSSGSDLPTCLRGNGTRQSRANSILFLHSLGASLPLWRRLVFIGVRSRPLKTLINEHKPRKPSRRTQRTKDVRPKQEFPDESDTSAVDFQSGPTTHLDATAQESSSQTSSADNGDPQTPSPLYSEAAVAHVDVTQTTELNGLGDASVDPHFARLMSALTLSAKASGTGDPSATSAAVGGMAFSHDTQTLKAPASGTHVVGGPAPVVRPGSSSRDTSRLNISSPKPHISPPLPSQSTLTPGLPSPSTKSPTHSRRSSMITADLSPYLARPAGIPMNGKRLKQLALLEAVADESSRMINASLRPATQTSPSPHEASHAPYHAPLSPNTVMSHNFTNLSPMYSNTHGPYIPSVPQTGPFNPPSPDNVFTVRPRTSNSFRPVPNHPPRSSNTRASMNQAQLLGALSGTSYPSTPGHYRSPVPPLPLLNFHSPNNYPPPPIHTVATGAPIFRTGPHPPTVGRGPPPPLRVLPSQTVSGPAAAAQSLPSTPGGSSKFGFPRPTVNPQNNQLLSILNRGSGQ
jgi:mRNA-decapping enzyme subunit 2